MLGRFSVVEGAAVGLEEAEFAAEAVENAAVGGFVAEHAGSDGDSGVEGMAEFGPDARLVPTAAAILATRVRSAGLVGR